MKFKVIIVNFNGYLDTLECLESLMKSSCQSFQLFVVDNSVNKDDFEAFKKWSENIYENIETKFSNLVYPISKKNTSDILFLTEDELNDKNIVEQKIIFVKAKENEGFSAANNIALKYLQKQNIFDYIWLLNNDTVVPIDFLRKISDKLERLDTRDGVIGNSLCYYDKPEILQCVANKYNNWLAHTFPLYEGVKYLDILKNHLYDLIPIGASMFIKKECFNEVGLLEEEYFLYFEEWDYTIRAKKKHWRSIIFTDIYIYHKHGTTIDKGNKEGKTKTLFSDYYLLKNKLLFAKKNLKFYYLPTVYLSYVPVVINRIKRKQWDRVKMVFKIILGLKLINEK